jgi:uncharacterized protein (DUF4415 family)
MKDRDIGLTRAHPEGDPAHIVRGIVRKGLTPFSPKQAISLRVDPSVLEWFRAQGTGWQTQMNAVLKAYVDAASRAQVPTARSTRTRAKPARAG